MIVSNDDSQQLPAANSIQKELETASPWEMGRIPPGLIESPIDFLFAEHHRQRQAANALRLVGNDKVNKPGVRKLIEFLKTDFAIHVEDEELGFFPLLRQYCLPEDNIGNLIVRLTEEHKKDEKTVASVIAILEGLLAGHSLNDESRWIVRAFAEHICRHLAIENATLLPIAHLRLDHEAQSILSNMMKERRNQW